MKTKSVRGRLAQLETELAFRKDQIKSYRDRDREIKVSNSGVDIDLNSMKYYSDIIHIYGSGAMDHYVEWLTKTIEAIKNRHSVSD